MITQLEEKHDDTAIRNTFSNKETPRHSKDSSKEDHFTIQLKQNEGASDVTQGPNSSAESPKRSARTEEKDQVSDLSRFQSIAATWLNSDSIRRLGTFSQSNRSPLTPKKYDKPCFMDTPIALSSIPKAGLRNITPLPKYIATPVFSMASSKEFKPHDKQTPQPDKESSCNSKIVLSPGDTTQEDISSRAKLNEIISQNNQVLDRTPFTPSVSTEEAQPCGNSNFTTSEKDEETIKPKVQTNKTNTPNAAMNRDTSSIMPSLNTVGNNRTNSAPIEEEMSAVSEMWPSKKGNAESNGSERAIIEKVIIIGIGIRNYLSHNYMKITFFELKVTGI